MTDAERTSAQAEEHEQATSNGGLLGKIAETAKSVVETVAERAPAAVSSVAATAGSAAGAVVEKVRGLGGGDAEGQELTTGVAEGSADVSETRPVAVSEAVEPKDSASSGNEQQAQPAEAGMVASVAGQVTETVRRRIARAYGAITSASSSDAPSEAAGDAVATVGEAATAARQRIARRYEGIAAKTGGEQAPTAPDGEAGATYTPTPEEGAQSGKPRRFKDVQPGMQLQGKVTSIALYGIFVDVGVGRDGLVHISEMSHRRIESPTDLVEIGAPVDVWVKSVDPDARRISLTMRDPSRSRPERVERRGPRKREINRERLAELKAGDSVEGVISSLAPFGAFVDIGVGKDGLVHVSELAEGRVERAEDAVQVGERYTFKILEVDPEGNRISLSLRRAQRTQRMQQLESGAVLDGTISGIAPFGAFVDIGVGRDGLVHVSELSSERVNSVEEAVKVGDKVQVKVIEVDPNSKRISLTMRVDEPLPNERERPEPRQAPAASRFGGEGAPPPTPSFNPAPSFSSPAPFGDEGRREDRRGAGARRGTGREGGRTDFGRGEGRADFGRGEGRGDFSRPEAGGGRRDRNERGGGRGGSRSDTGRGRREGQSFEPAEDVYTVGDTEEETFTGDATLEDLMSKFNAGKGRDRRQSQEEDDEDRGRNSGRRADAIRRTLALRDEE